MIKLPVKSPGHIEFLLRRTVHFQNEESQSRYTSISRERSGYNHFFLVNQLRKINRTTSYLTGHKRSIQRSVRVQHGHLLTRLPVDVFEATDHHHFIQSLVVTHHGNITIRSRAQILQESMVYISIRIQTNHTRRGNTVE